MVMYILDNSKTDNSTEKELTNTLMELNTKVNGPMINGTVMVNTPTPLEKLLKKVTS